MPSIQDVKIAMRVIAADGQELGTVKRIWYPEGRVEPPDPSEQGLLTSDSGDYGSSAKQGFFQIDRPHYIDWYIPFEHVQAVARDQVTLDVGEDEVERRGWQQKPASG